MGHVQPWSLIVTALGIAWGGYRTGLRPLPRLSSYNVGGESVQVDYDPCRSVLGRRGHSKVRHARGRPVSRAINCTVRSSLLRASSPFLEGRR